METISHIETHDTSAIRRLEDADIEQRKATATATRLAAMIKVGLGIGIGGTGIGFGALLVLYGVSLLIGRPILEEVKSAMGVQAAAFERVTNEKIEAIKNEAAERVAAAEKAAAQLSAAAKATEEKAVSASKTRPDEAATVASGKTVVDFTVFRTRQIEGIEVVTGWKYKALSDSAPSFQYCHMLRSSSGNNLQLPIARNGKAIPFDLNLATKVGITWTDVQKALPYCDWFNGVNPNIQETVVGYPERTVTRNDRPI